MESPYQITDCISPVYEIPLANVLKFGRDSAVKYHNGTLRPCARTSPSEAYLELLQRFESESNGSKLDNPWASWDHVRYPVPAREHGVGFVSSIRQWVMSRWGSSPPSTERLLPPLTAEAEVFYNALSELKDAIQADGSPMQYIGLSVPTWLTDAQIVHIFSAAVRANLLIMDIGHPPAAAAASHGIDLCRISSEYLPCQPERVMTLDLSRNALTASVLNISPDYLLLQGLSYSVNHTLGTDQLDVHGISWQEPMAWVNNFARDKGITKLYLIGPNAKHPTFYRAVQNSDVAPLLQKGDNISFERVVALGAAVMTKETMESQSTDCLEPGRCEQIRNEADRLAGKLASTARPSHSEL
ncbi:hypothetical protein GP486_007225 [Trichoglossum hirsutum]|uniref:Uncharacterized protein n=1 Tax=Trichoglossum hirsutum TaxID=265104 RepID=A0A9P8IJL9_9PEZI|nr:hypothetical protein GP486_007225 [Trichoglossum hirsutum]